MLFKAFSSDLMSFVRPSNKIGSSAEISKTLLTLLHQLDIRSVGLFFDRSLKGQSCCNLSDVSCRVIMPSETRLRYKAGTGVRRPSVGLPWAEKSRHAPASRICGANPTET